MSVKIVTRTYFIEDDTGHELTLSWFFPDQSYWHTCNCVTCRAGSKKMAIYDLKRRFLYSAP
jgi:hypothetical protein